MGSNDKDVQSALKAKAEQELELRLTTLKERGLTEKALMRDCTVRHLQADVSALNRRLRTIDSLEKKEVALAERKAAKIAAAAKAPKKKSKKKVEAAPPPKKQGKAKKKKK